MRDRSADLNNRLQQGLALHQQGFLKEAKAVYEQIIATDPEHFDALQLTGAIALQHKKYEDCVKLLSKAVRVKKNYAPAYFNLGIALHELKQFDQAVHNYHQAIRLDNQYTKAFNGLGCALKELKQYQTAIENFNKVINLNPKHAEAYNNIGLVRQELNEYRPAIKAYEMAISIKPEYFTAYYNRGIALNSLKQFDEAVTSFNLAIQLKNDFAEAFNGLGYAKQQLRQYDDAIACYKKAICLKPDFADAHSIKSHLKILLGDYEEGWALYEWRWKSSGLKRFYREFSQPLWLGQTSIKDKVILIHPEQGLGDSIQFCRYIAMIEALAPKKIILEVPKALISLLYTLKSQVTFIEQGQAIPEFDLHCPMMSLPHAFKTIVATIPADIPYLFAEKSKTKRWQDKLGPITKPRIGLAWSGSINHKNDHNRSLLLKQLTALFDLPFEFHSLQKEIRPNDLEALNTLKQVNQHHDALNDFSDTAALIENMDLVISVDTSVAHLAGAMGKKVFILLPFAPDYRWMLDRSDSPWYQTATLFRQPEIDDWNSVIDQVRLALVDFQ